VCPVKGTPLLDSRRTIQVRRSNDLEEGTPKCVLSLWIFLCEDILKFVLSYWILCCQSLKVPSRNVRHDISFPLHLSASYLHIHEVQFTLLDVPPSYPNNTIK
jgi:hypothetical protein